MNCKTCGTPLLKRATKNSPDRLNKQYYYTHYYYCTRCQKMYLSDEFKVLNKTSDLFSSQSTDSSQQPDIEIWTDGACSNNGKENAKASWAFVAGDHEEAGLVDGKQTNNRGEALAVYHALKWAGEKGTRHVKIYTDSQITLYGLAKRHENVKENRDLFALIAEVIEKNNLSVSYEKVLGHSGDANNERADSLATSLVGLPSSK